MTARAARLLRSPRGWARVGILTGLAAALVVTTVAMSSPEQAQAQSAAGRPAASAVVPAGATASSGVTLP